MARAPPQDRTLCQVSLVLAADECIRRWVMHRLLFFCVIALITFWMTNVQAADMHKGKVVSTSAGKLTMTDVEGKNQHTMDVSTTAMVMRDGKTAALADLKPGDMITV